jgi:nucleotide-binding universal stress UspA family protein
MKTILVPTDFSHNASNALEYAIGLAKKENAKIILAHAYYDVFVSGEIPAHFLLEQMAQTKKNAEDKLAEIALKVKAENIPCEIMAIESRPVDMVLNEAEKLKPDFIVMGTKGSSDLLDTLFGSNTAKIIEKANCPVLAIPEKAVYQSVNNIIFTTEYHLSDLMPIKNLCDIANFFNATITVLHVALDDDAIDADEEQLMEDFKANVLKTVNYKKLNFKLLYGPEFLDALETYIDDTSPDLIAMATQPRGFFKSIFHASSTRNFSYHSNIPLLTFHVKDESSGMPA